MSKNALLTDPESIRSNQNGQFTKSQLISLKSRLGDLPGWIILVLLFALMVVVLFVGGKSLTRSTPLAIAAMVAVILVTFAIVSFLNGILANLRIKDISIVQTPGQVTWRGNQYAAVAGGRTLNPIDYTTLPPGDYTFYLLRGTNYLLSAQPANRSLDSSPARPPVSLQSLKSLVDQPLDFDPRLEPARAARHMEEIKLAIESLNSQDGSGISQQEAAELAQKMTERAKQLMQGESLQGLLNLGNMIKEAETTSQLPLDHSGLAQLTNALDEVGIRHPGSLHTNTSNQQTTGQRLMLSREIGSNLFWAVVVTIGWLALSYLALTRGNWTNLLIVTAFFLLILVLLGSSARSELFDLLSGKVQVEEGWVSKFTRTNHTGRTSVVHHFFQVNQNTLEVSQSAYNALVEGNYRVFFLPNTKRLVNIDPLQDGST